MSATDPIAPTHPSHSARLRRPVGIAAIVLVVAGLGYALSVAVNAARHDAQRSDCKGKLSQISLALYCYHQDYGCYPPAYIADENGRPMHSWRVLLLPYWEVGDFYRRYRFDEPWDGPNNRKLGEETGSPYKLYHCVSDRPETAGADNSRMTSYVVVTGPETAWSGSRTSRSDITNDPASTFLVVEVANSGIHWMEPRDLDIREMELTINSKAGKAISSRHHLGAWGITADRGVRFLFESLTPAQVRQRLTIRGGQTVSDGDR